MTEKDQKIMKFLEQFVNENMGNRMTNALAIGLLNGAHQLLSCQEQIKPADAMALDPR